MKKTVSDIINEYGLDSSFWRIDVNEIKVELLAKKIISEYLDMLVDPWIDENLAYGLSEYSLYYGYGVKGLLGKWY